MAPCFGRRGFLALGAGLAACQAAAAARPQMILKAADGRGVRISIWAPAGRQRGVILFSHGALSAPEKYENLLSPWAEAGFRVLAPLHVDSTDHPDHAHYGMTDSWRARLLDMRAVAEFAGADSAIAAGHSYGALVALTLGGVRAEPPPGVTATMRDPRVHSVVAFSPPGPMAGLIMAAGYEGLATPALIETGHRDIPFGVKNGDWHVHLTAYDRAPAGDKYALVLDDADHYFGGLICRPELPGPKQTAGFTQAVRVSTAFLNAYGAHDVAARAELTGAPGAEILHK